MPDNIMKDAEGKPVNVPAKEEPEIVTDAEGNPVVPTGTEPPMSEAPKDTLPRPSPQPQVPEQQVPETTQETAPPRATEGVITFDELAAKKGFKTPDDMAKSYINMESQTKRVEATLSDVMEARQEKEPEKLPETTLDLEGEEEKDALKIVDSRINKKVKALEDVTDYRLHLIQNPDDQQYAVDAIKVVKENPGIKWSTAFKVAKADAVETKVATAKEEGKNEAYANIEQKQTAQTIPGGGQRPATQTVTAQQLMEGIKSGTVKLSEARKLINSLSQK